MTTAALREALQVALREMGVDEPDPKLERPKDPAHGDWATNVAMTFASALRRSPRSIAEELASTVKLEGTGAVSAEVAGPGFLNFRLATSSVAQGLVRILGEGEAYGRSSAGAGVPVMIEWVSANPTGPLHLGHGRQAALGDAIASLLEWTGWEVHREFYYNDAGRQMELLAASVRARYVQLQGGSAEVPEGGYHGEYVRDVARALHREVGDRFLEDDGARSMEKMRSFASRALMAEINQDLDELGVHFDEYFEESSLYEGGMVDDVVERLRATGLVYEHEGAVWLRTTEFGDQKDRVMLKSDGSPTYFLPDVAYHLTKWDRGFHAAINVQGSDHHGTVQRVRAGLQALGLPEEYPEYVIHQMVTVERGGEEVKLSKRAGSYTTLRELFEEVGVDVTRYFFQMRRPEAHLIFDLDVALDQSEKNPIYKIQYAHARMHSIFSKAGVEAESITAEDADLSRLEADAERELIKQLVEFPDWVTRAAEQRAPHHLCEYLERTAGQVNSWYHEGNPSRNPGLAVLVEDEGLRTARLALARAVGLVLANGLEILGIRAPRRMDRDAEAVTDS